MTGRALFVWTLATVLGLLLGSNGARASDGPLLPGLGESPAADPVFEPETPKSRPQVDPWQDRPSSRGSSNYERHGSEPNRLDQLPPVSDRQPASRLTRPQNAQPQKNGPSRDNSRGQTQANPSTEPHRDPRMLRQTPRSAAPTRTDVPNTQRSVTSDRNNGATTQRDQYRARQEFERRQALERMQRSGAGQRPANTTNRNTANPYQANPYQANPNPGHSNPYQSNPNSQTDRRTGTAKPRPARPTRTQEPPAVSPWERDAAERAATRPAQSPTANPNADSSRTTPRTTFGGLLRRR